MNYKGTQHANMRISQRLNITKKNLRNKSINLAIKKGYPRSYFSGSFRQYLDSKTKMNMQVKVYNNTVYIYKNKVVITVFPVPKKYLPIEDYFINFTNSPLLDKINKDVGEDNVSFERMSKDKSGYTYMLLINKEYASLGTGELINLAKEDAIRNYYKLKEQKEND